MTQLKTFNDFKSNNNVLNEVTYKYNPDVYNNALSKNALKKNPLSLDQFNDTFAEKEKIRIQDIIDEYIIVATYDNIKYIIFENTYINYDDFWSLDVKLVNNNIIEEDKYEISSRIKYNEYDPKSFEKNKNKFSQMLYNIKEFINRQNITKQEFDTMLEY